MGEQKKHPVRSRAYQENKAHTVSVVHISKSHFSLSTKLQIGRSCQVWQCNKALPNLWLRVTSPSLDGYICMSIPVYITLITDLLRFPKSAYQYYIHV